MNTHENIAETMLSVYDDPRNQLNNEVPTIITACYPSTVQGNDIVH